MSSIEGSRCPAREILSEAKNDNGEPIRLFLSDELITHYVGINDNTLRPYDSTERMEILRIVTILS